MMGRKHYEALAQALRLSADIDTAIVKVADVCQRDNDRFDRQRFYAACKGQQGSGDVTVQAGTAEGKATQ